jgi:hypothetical protein
MSDIRYIDPVEFVAKGYLQEVNRRFLHILGLALEIYVDDDGKAVFSGVWDYRDDPEGIVFGEVDTEKVLAVQEELDAKIETRQAMFGWFLQPYEVPSEEESTEEG